MRTTKSRKKHLNASRASLKKRQSTIDAGFFYGQPHTEIISKYFTTWGHLIWPHHLKPALTDQNEVREEIKESVLWLHVVNLAGNLRRN